MMKSDNCNEAELSFAKQIVLDAVLESQSLKREDGKMPDYATLNEIATYTHMEAPEALKVLRGLYKEGRIVYRSTVNGTHMFGIKENNG